VSSHLHHLLLVEAKLLSGQSTYLFFFLLIIFLSKQLGAFGAFCKKRVNHVFENLGRCKQFKMSFWQ
jgi:hypothetical protein